ncbi:MAG: hypothetical protein AAFN78_06750 [Pseudomonadota bacterium]
MNVNKSGLRLLGVTALAVFATSVASAADVTQRSGTTVMGEWTDSVKTPKGKEWRSYRVVYDWDTGITTREEYDANDQLIGSTTRKAAPSPTPEEIAEAAAIVEADVEVQQIRRQQGGLALEGGFVMRHKPEEGPCTQSTRCVQMFLFDGENVVRQILVDLKSRSILEPDYIPPRNRRAAQ